jgi:hypothetical protein
VLLMSDTLFIQYVFNKSTNGWGKKIGELRGEEEVLQLYTCQSYQSSPTIQT